PNNPWAPMNYAGNNGGPGVIRDWSGTIVPPFTCSTTNMLPHPAVPLTTWPVGTCWWGANANFGYFGIEGITDGTSNTALFSEKLLGWPAGGSGPLPFAGGNTDAKRGIYFSPNMPLNYDSVSAQSALQGVQVCQSIPGTTQAQSGSWLLGW